MELQGIRKYHDFVINRDHDGNAQLKVREVCGSGDFIVRHLKLRRGEFPSHIPHQIISLQSEHCYPRSFLTCRPDPDRWPDYISTVQASDSTSHITEQPASTITTTHCRVNHCSIPGCDGTDHKNVQRWSQGHTTRAGCPIYHSP